MRNASGGKLAPGRGLPGKEMRKAQGKGFKLLSHCDFGNNTGDVMQMMLKGNHLICGHIGLTGRGLTILDVSDSRNPRIVNQLPSPLNTHNTKVQLAGDILIVNNEQTGTAVPFRAGVDIYDASRLPELRHISFFPVGGKGVHRMWFADGRYAYIPGGDDEYIDQFLRILDLSDPAKPREAGRWWWPGMRKDEARDWFQVNISTFKKKKDGSYVRPPDAPPGMAATRVALHTPYGFGDRCYCAWWDCGFLILDTSDKSRPKLVSRLDLPFSENNCTHSILFLPERKLCVVVDEFVAYDCEDMPKQIRVVDIGDEKHPKVLSMLPIPQGDYYDHGGRFGPHNLHENRPGSLIDPDHVYQCYFNGGLRVYNIKDPRNPKEVAHYIPPTPNRKPVHIMNCEVVQSQVDDVYVATDGRVFLSERLGDGVWILEKEF
ncbi:MAG: hypothetical protein AAB502_00990 [Chloroflexota bacterium]